jgi:hypothetical protein
MHVAPEVHLSVVELPAADGFGYSLLQGELTSFHSSRPRPMDAPSRRMPGLTVHEARSLILEATRGSGRFLPLEEDAFTTVESTVVAALSEARARDLTVTAIDVTTFDGLGVKKLVGGVWRLHPEAARGRYTVARGDLRYYNCLGRELFGKVLVTLPRINGRRRTLLLRKELA